MRSRAADRLIAGLVNAIYPAVCPSCAGSADNLSYAPFCKDCWSKITRYDGASCRICSTPFAADYSGICSECLSDPPAFSRARHFGIYENTLATAIHTFKFQGIRRLHKPLGKLLTGFDFEGVDAIIAVPLSLKGLRERGFNQSLLLSRVLSDTKNIPLIMDGLRKKTDTPPQLGLTKKERTINLRGAFECRDRVSGMRLLLVDDVMTTGATARECSKELMKAGAKQIMVLTLARAGNL
jgi:ComF family protein